MIRFKQSDFIGTKIEMLTIISFEGVVKNRGTSIKVKCDCGSTKIAYLSELLNGHTKSCGCLRSNNFIVRSTKHNLTAHPLFHIWNGMKYRCYNQKYKGYKNYGAKGVVVCDEWKHDFLAFYTWAIKNNYQKGLQLDKDIKGNGMLYSPQTCSFVTRTENMRYTSRAKLLTLNGETKPMSEWAEITGLSYATIKIRIFRRKWNVEKALTEPHRCPHRLVAKPAIVAVASVAAAAAFD